MINGLNIIAVLAGFFVVGAVRVTVKNSRIIKIRFFMQVDRFRFSQKYRNKTIRINSIFFLILQISITLTLLQKHRVSKCAI